MIRINLLSNSAGGGVAAGTGITLQASPEEKEIQRQGAMRLLVILLFPAALYAYEYMHLPDLNARLRSKQNVLADLQKKNDQAKTAVEEIQQFNQEKSKLQKQIDALDSLRKDRQKEVKILDSIQKDIPDKVWLTRVELKERDKDNNSKLLIDGMATADPELTSFMETLSKSVFYKSVNLIRSQEVQSDKGVLKSFEVSCDIDRDIGNNNGPGMPGNPPGGH
jgi:type IV pilus assembly protein PilN